MNSHPPSKFVCRASAGETLELPWGRIAWTASRAIGNSATMTFGRATILAGRQNPRHRHPNCDEILHVISGQLEHTIGEERVALSAGDTISIPKGVWHQAYVVGADDAEVVICFSSADRMTEVEE